MSNKMILGEWGGEKIWRNKTAEEKLLNILNLKDIPQIDLSAEEVAKLAVNYQLGEAH